jgi:hypothetical protein
MEKNKETKNMKKIQLLVKLGQIFVMMGMMWGGPLPKAIAQVTSPSSNPSLLLDDTDNVDWRIAGNNGGSRLTIEDLTFSKIPFTIEANVLLNNPLYINQAGNIGIGTSTPARSLTILRNATNPNNASAVRFQDSSVSPNFQWTMLGDFRSFRIQEDLSGTVPFAIDPGAPQSSFVIAPGPRVGIGTNAPETQLHIAGTGDPDTAQTTQDIFNGVGPHPAPNNGPAFNFGYSGASFGRGSGFFNVRPDAGSGGPNPSLRFMTQNCQRMIIDRNGNVGIGNFGADNTNNIAPCTGLSPGTSPVSRLHVKGDVRVEGGSFIDDNVALNVPDYVFEPDYELMPLDDLQAYIEKEKHLPDIPSAQDIKEQGVKLGEMQMQLLRKVEELTLYTIQQDKKFMALQDQNQKLTAENTQLQARLSEVEAVIKQLGQR